MMCQHNLSLSSKSQEKLALLTLNPHFSIGTGCFYIKTNCGRLNCTFSFVEERFA
jgi:hypothetical protein